MSTDKYPSIFFASNGGYCLCIILQQFLWNTSNQTTKDLSNFTYNRKWQFSAVCNYSVYRNMSCSHMTEKYNILLMKNSIPKKETPPALYDLVQLASEVHNYSTRYATNQNIYRPPSRSNQEKIVSWSNYGLARFRVVASQIWEAIPIEVKCLPFNTFRKEYKRLLLD